MEQEQGILGSTLASRVSSRTSESEGKGKERKK
jgi:hypothetical protein